MINGRPKTQRRNHHVKSSQTISATLNVDSILNPKLLGFLLFAEGGISVLYRAWARVLLGFQRAIYLRRVATLARGTCLGLPDLFLGSKSPGMGLELADTVYTVHRPDKPLRHRSGPNPHNKQASPLGIPLNVPTYRYLQPVRQEQQQRHHHHHHHRHCGDSDDDDDDHHRHYPHTSLGTTTMTTVCQAACTDLGTERRQTQDQRRDRQTRAA